MAKATSESQAIDYCEKTINPTAIAEEAAVNNDNESDAVAEAISTVEARIEEELSGTDQALIDHAKDDFRKIVRSKTKGFFLQP